MTLLWFCLLNVFFVFFNSNANNKLGLNNRQGFLMQMKNLLNKVQCRYNRIVK